MKLGDNFCVYIHRKASDGTIFYVGKGRPIRPHSPHNRSKFWNYVAAKHGFTVQIIKDAMHDPCACTLEKLLIKALRQSGVRLCNGTNGGEGGPGSKSGKDSHWFGVTKENHPMFGRKHSPETLEKISKAVRGKPKCQKWRDAYKTGDKVRATPKPYKLTERGRENVARAAREHSRKRIDMTLHVFRHNEHGEVIMCQYDFFRAYNVGRGNLCWLVKGKKQIVKGWTYHGVASVQKDKAA